MKTEVSFCFSTSDVFPSYSERHTEHTDKARPFQVFSVSSLSLSLICWMDFTRLADVSRVA